MKNELITSIEHFKPHTFQAEQGEGLFQSHSHEWDELTLILDGEGYYSSAEQNLKVVKGSLILIPAGLHHGFVCIQPWKGTSVHFQYKKLPAFCQHLMTKAYQKPLQIHTAQLNERHLDWADLCLAQLEEEWRASAGENGANELSDELLRNIFETLLLLFHKHLLEQQTSADHPRDGLIVQEVLREIHRNYNTSLTINEIAARHFLSQSMLRRKFVDAIGVSPKQYIIQVRLEEAKRLLEQTNKAIEYIASEVGFTSSSRFYDLFVRMVGVTPLEWRKQSARSEIVQ